MMDVKPNIRNMIVIAPGDHGKTVTDLLVCKAGIIASAKAGTVSSTPPGGEEQERGIMTKSTVVPLYFELNEEVPPGTQGKAFLISLMIDSPTHVDMSSEAATALRVSDGALVVVDCVEGVCVQTETVLRQALGERIKPCLVVDNVDCMLGELQNDPEDMYQSFSRAIESVNAVIATFHDDKMGDVQVDPTKGTVAFGSGLHRWAFSLNTFARMYAQKFGVDKAKMMERLWGDNYFDTNGRKWKNCPTADDGSNLRRSFCRFILDPIFEMASAIMGDDKPVIERMLTALNIQLKPEEKCLLQKNLLMAVMRTWLPAADCLLAMAVLHLPCPTTAQEYRCETLYTGPQDDPYATAFRKCDPNGPLIMYVSKMVPTNDRGRFYAFGRVFSGTIHTGMQVRIMGGNFTTGKKDDLFIQTIQRTLLMMGHTTQPVEDCPSGNVIGLVGVDQLLVKSGTITDAEDAWPIKDMRFFASPVVRVAVEPKNPADLPKLVEGLKCLAKSDSLCQCYTEVSGEFIIACVSEQHLEICLKVLRNEYCTAELRTSGPFVAFRETVSTLSTGMCISKTPNRHNCLFMKAEPLVQGLPDAIESTAFEMKADPMTRARELTEKYGWDVRDPRLLEPVYLVDVQCPESVIVGVHSVLNKRRATIISEEPRPGAPLRYIRVYLPVLESFGFTADLRANTANHAFSQCIFDHWKPVPGDPLDGGSTAGHVVLSVRKRKGMKEDIPCLGNFVD
eukprot:m51a1_g7281 putative elongation factor 2 (734) ;mRNA; r:14964-17516